MSQVPLAEWLLASHLADSAVLGYLRAVLLTRSLDNKLFPRIAMTFPGPLISCTLSTRRGLRLSHLS